ncbi:MAG TPA: HIRAN domain-containing protein [Xanthobacteraceae bacterium]|nr:HIRAN domain-containing protein [Xanthobacteraceae bacterium]
MQHACHWPGCEVETPPSLFMCRPHWHALPRALRRAVWDAYRKGQERDKDPSREYVAAARAALDWALGAVLTGAGPAMSQRTVIVGTGHKGAQALRTLARLRPGDVLRLVREPANAFDRDAVAVYAGPQHLGYVPRQHNAGLARTLDDDPASLVAVLTAEAIVSDGKVRFAPKIEIRDRLDDLLTRSADA